eukprot:12553057-Ditylum_brightwellii.AAC.2
MESTKDIDWAVSLKKWLPSLEMLSGNCCKPLSISRNPIIPTLRWNSISGNLMLSFDAIEPEPVSKFFTVAVAICAYGAILPVVSIINTRSNSIDDGVDPLLNNA